MVKMFSVNSPVPELKVAEAECWGLEHWERFVSQAEYQPNYKSLII